MVGDPDLPQREGVLLRTAWAEALQTSPSAFEGTGVTRLTTDGLAAVVVVEFGAALVVAAPPSAKAALAELPPAALRDVDAIAAALPGSHQVGTAHLLCTGIRPPHPRHPVVEASSLDVASVGAALPPEEWSEAGVQEMERRWAVRTAGAEGGHRGEETAAVAGYQRWHGTVAHLGVATTPTRRGQGYARSAATRAICAAIDAGLLAQWRCRVGNDASLRLAERLGFTRLGRQSAVALSAH